MAIRRTIAEDLYVVLNSADAATQAASFEIVVNPLVNWLWLGFGILAIGTGIALLPERTYSFALSKLPASEAAATTAALTLALVLGGAPFVSAQTGEQVQPQQRSALLRQLESEIMCTCSCRRSLSNCGMMNCHGLDSQGAKLQAHLASGKDHDQVVAAFVAEFGQEILMSPIDEGFNRLAWLFPYLVGASGAVAIGFVAVRWSRRQQNAHAEALPAADPALDERLDDELRNLD